MSPKLQALAADISRLGSGSYAADDVCFLLQRVELPSTQVAEKERLIQTQAKHYSEMISLEEAPSAEHLDLYKQALAQHGLRMATEVQRLALGLQQQFQLAGNAGPLVLLSLVRAGLPLGVLLRRALIGLGCDAVHYGISIIRDRGIDPVALNAVIEQHGTENLVFVDGWTGKGAIAGELNSCLVQDPRFACSPKLVVLADPCGQAWMAASAEDWLIPSGILGATVSGLVSRSIWPVEAGLHACIFYDYLAAYDVSREFVEEINRLRLTLGSLDACQPWTAAKKTSLQAAAEAVINQLSERFAVTNLNRLKPGIAEATRAVLRRMPEQVLVRDKHDSDVQLLLYLAKRNGVLVKELGESLGAYRAVTLIRSLGK